MTSRDTKPASYLTAVQEASVITPNHHRKPLIDYCTNEWRKSPDYKLDLSRASAEEPGKFEDLQGYLRDCYDSSAAVIRAPKIRRLLLIALLVIPSLVWVWLKLLYPWMLEELAIRESLSLIKMSSSSKDLFGTNMRVDFPGIHHIAQMDPVHLPRQTNHEQREIHPEKRLIFVGDIHGCKKELGMLLEKANYNPSSDHLVTTGDMISKGPDSIGVVEFLRQHNASCVRGNHDDRLLLMAEQRKASAIQAQKNRQSERLHDESQSRKHEADQKLANALSPEQLTYLRSCPVILKIGAPSKSGGEYVVVHAGLVAGLSFENQDPASVMNMRVVDLGSHFPSKSHTKKNSVPWFKLWNAYQKQLVKGSPASEYGDGKQQKRISKPTTVIYGHDAKKGLQINKYTKGLDSGCVYGGKLTALIISSSGDEKLVQVQCSDYSSHKARFHLNDGFHYTRTKLNLLRTQNFGIGMQCWSVPTDNSFVPVFAFRETSAARPCSLFTVRDSRYNSTRSVVRYVDETNDVVDVVADLLGRLFYG